MKGQICIGYHTKTDACYPVHSCDYKLHNGINAVRICIGSLCFVIIVIINFLIHPCYVIIWRNVLLQSKCWRDIDISNILPTVTNEPYISVFL